MSEQVITIEDIDITLFKSKNAKSINITIKPFKGVRVSVPSSISYDRAQSAVKQRMSWIKKNLSKIQGAEELFTVFDYDTEFKTREHQLKLIEGNFDNLKSVVRSNTISVYIPKELDVLSDEVQMEIRKAIERAWRKEAKAYLPDRVNHLANKNDFSFNKVSVQNSKTRWGSCSVDNNINLSLHLMRLPDHLIDYVILHELTHTKVKNHSPQFWQLLDQVSGNARILDKETNSYNIQIY
jgi:predicted metal-dependent hydrolase